MAPESETRVPLLRKRELLAKIRSWFSRQWADIRPGSEARHGAVWGCIAAAFAGAIAAGNFLNTGFGLLPDILFCILAGAFVILLSILLIPFVLTIIRKLPRLASGLISGSVIILLLAFSPIGVVLGPLACLCAGFLGAAIATLLHRNFRSASTKKKIMTAALCILSLAGISGQVLFLAADGSLDDMTKARLNSAAPEAPSAPDPGARGSFNMRVVYYGTKGGNPQRPEYNNPTIATPTVDASKFFKEFKGWKQALRRKYWGYGFDRLPLNATVWLPDGAGPFPLVLIVHGNHGMAEFSDPGYEYLGKLLASRGFILASVDENFLNSGLFHDPPNQQPVRGWMLLEHLKLWRDWSKNPQNPLHVKIDFQNIALIGHSRGGEAAATAVLFNRLSHYPEDATIRFDYRFPIRSVVAIAPADGQYKPAGERRWIDDVNYFTLQGANDSDVSSFAGSLQWERVRYRTGGDWFKSELYIYRANHGQFNTVWGRSDFGYPLGWFLNLKPLLDPGQQRRIAEIYISAFLEATLHGRREYLPVFRDYRSGRKWLPETLYVNRYQDAGYRLIADFGEDPDISTATLPGAQISAADLSLWKEGRIPFRNSDRDYNGVFIGWNRNRADGKEDAKIKPIYSITLPESSSEYLNGASAIVLSLATLDQDAPLLNEKEAKEHEESKGDAPKERESPDFTVELQAADGAAISRPLSAFGALLPPLKVRFTKLKFLDNRLYKQSSEPVFQTILMPLSAFSERRGLDAAKIRTVRLRFNRTRTGVVLLSKVGLQ